ncbi:low-density lipoprotein receptor class A repeat-containing protein [Endozoicomonas sp. ONNA2]|uniref:low-density lipoprotein receptor class A repeat-containing protein n=1 Tax=Endozoicomonas sp. ONNA2 TaxID=2828741 RepID=UPI002147DEFD|nr:low-density lipoprotein receptor class A repeat-containing protein [Endozoicomonas sp. ONNA2]
MTKLFRDQSQVRCELDRYLMVQSSSHPMQVLTPMQPIASQLPSPPSAPKAIVRDTVCRHRSSDKSRTISTIPASPLIYPGNKARGWALSDYRVCQFARGAMQAGNSLMRSVAGFAFQQVMESPEVGLVCPGLKESLVVLLALPTMVSGYPMKACGDGKLQCLHEPHRCIPKTDVCNGYPDCPDQSDERFFYCPERTKCEVEDAFLCNNSKICVPFSRQCDGYNDCLDWSDESPALCPPTTQTPESSTAITASSSTYLQAGPFFGLLVGLSCASLVTCYCIVAVHLRVRTMRSDNPEASTCQLLQMAIRQPHYYRQHAQPVPVDAHEYAIVPATGPGRSGEAQQVSCRQATELPSCLEATELPSYLQIMREAPPTYEEAIADTRL